MTESRLKQRRLRVAREHLEHDVHRDAEHVALIAARIAAVQQLTITLQDQLDCLRCLFKMFRKDVLLYLNII